MTVARGPKLLGRQVKARWEESGRERCRTGHDSLHSRAAGFSFLSGTLVPRQRAGRGVDPPTGSRSPRAGTQGWTVPPDQPPSAAKIDWRTQGEDRLGERPIIQRSLTTPLHQRHRCIVLTVENAPGGKSRRPTESFSHRCPYLKLVSAPNPIFLARLRLSTRAPTSVSFYLIGAPLNCNGAYYRSLELFLEQPQTTKLISRSGTKMTLRISFSDIHLFTASLARAAFSASP